MSALKLGGRLPTVVSATLWAAAVAAGFGVLLDFDTRPGDAGDPPATWPEDTSIARPPGTFELLMILHPHCPCSRASLTELERIAARGRGRLYVSVLLYAPAQAGEGWSDTDSRRRAEAIPGAEVILDATGAEQRRFGLRTSGHVLLYDAAGALRFSGGITAARGHEGDSMGAAAILSLVSAASPAATAAFEPGARRAAFRTAPVFGCPLEGSDACPRR